MNNQRKKLIVFFAAPLLLLLALAVMEGGTFAGYNKFLAVKLLMIYWIMLAFQCLFTFLFRKQAVGILVNTTVFTLLSLVTYQRVKITGDPLLPSDVLLAIHAKDIVSFVQLQQDWFLKISLLLIGCIAAAIPLLYLKYGDRAEKLSFRKRLAIDLVCVLFFCGTVYMTAINHNFRHATMKKLDVPISAFNPVSDYRENGTVLTFFPRIGDLMVKTKEGYSADAIETIREKQQDTGFFTPQSDLHPTVIAIQSEAWWDPEAMPNVTYSAPLMEKLYSLPGIKAGQFYTPVYMGGTCIPEFEFLTGYSYRFLPSNTYPYIQFIHDYRTSIVQVLKDSGYRTSALHTYHKRFYSRHTAYPLLGFDTYLGIEDLKDVEIAGEYASDMYMTEQIIRLYKEKRDAPLFLFAVSMQNHGGYMNKKYDHFDVTVQSDALTKDELFGLQNYVQGVYDANEAFIALTEYFAAVSEPVVIMMYGDHLPLLGDEGSTYLHGGMVTSDTEKFVAVKQPQLYHTPYVVWANYDISDYEIPQNVSGANLGLWMLKMTNVQNVPWQYHLFRTLYEQYPVVQHNVVLDAEQNDVTGTVNEDNTPLMKAYALVEYDLLLGRRFAE